MSISIQIVCNEQYTLDALNKELADSGYNIHLGKDIMEAVEFSEEIGLCNIALFCILPSNVKSMLVLLELMKHKRPNTNCIMILAMDDADVVSECLVRGAAAVLTPPLNRKQIIAAISNIVQEHSERNNRIRVLILEDDPISGKILSNYLEPFGNCNLVTDGKSAVELFESALRSNERYQLIFIDIMVPEIQGHDVLKIIREVEKKKGIPIEKKAKIIMTTSLSDAENIIESFKANCDSYLIKPIRKNKLINEIKSLGLLQGADNRAQ